MYFFYTAGSSNGFEGMESVCPRQTTVTLSKTPVFVIDKYVEDVKQDEKHVPDLLESMMRPPGLVKEWLRPNLFKMDGFDSKLPENTLSICWAPEIRHFPAGRQCRPARY